MNRTCTGMSSGLDPPDTTETTREKVAARIYGCVRYGHQHAGI